MAWEYWFEATGAVRVSGGNGLFGAAAGSVAPVNWIAMVSPVLTLSSVLAIQTMIAFGLERPLSCIFATTGPASVLPSLGSLHYLGATRAGAAILIAEISIAVATWTMQERQGVDLRRGTAAPAIFEIDSPTRLAREYIGTITHRSSLSDRKSSATGIVLQ